MPDLREPLPTAPCSSALSALEQALRLLTDDLALVEQRLERLLESTTTIIPVVGGHLAFAKGKRFRPLLTLLAAQAACFDRDDRLTVAVVGELLHTATLLHDDVVDAGEFRRGRPTARICYGNGLAVLTGDFCFARALEAITRTEQLVAIRTLSQAVTRMAEGEVAQLSLAGDPDLDHERYARIIDGKTAALIAWCASVAGLVESGHASSLRKFGRELGHAFQITDDVIDYVSDLSAMGKAPGQDLRDGKMTLPLILACEEDPVLHVLVRSALQDGPPLAEDRAREIVHRVVASQAIARSSAVARCHIEKACQALSSTLPDSIPRRALIELAASVGRRSC